MRGPTPADDLVCSMGTAEKEHLCATCDCTDVNCTFPPGFCHTLMAETRLVIHGICLINRIQPSKSQLQRHFQSSAKFNYSSCHNLQVRDACNAQINFAL